MRCSTWTQQRYGELLSVADYDKCGSAYTGSSKPVVRSLVFHCARIVGNPNRGYDNMEAQRPMDADGYGTLSVREPEESGPRRMSRLGQNSPFQAIISDVRGCSEAAVPVSVRERRGFRHSKGTRVLRDHGPGFLQRRSRPKMTRSPSRTCGSDELE